MLNLVEYGKHFEQLGPITVGGNNKDNPILLQELVDAVEITKAKQILEIGFNNGGGALAFLMAPSEPTVMSVDCNQNNQSSIYLSGEFYGRFYFKQMNSDDLMKVFKPTNFDLVYIDGDHHIQGVQRDITSSIELKIPYILFDDTENKSHPYIVEIVHVGVEQHIWEIVKTYNNKILVRVTNDKTNDDGAINSRSTKETI